jgi:hypothetical protein
MKSFRPTFLAATFFATSLTLAFMAAPAGAQTGAASSKGTSAVPRTPDGKPDLNGVYQAHTTRRGTWSEANSTMAAPGGVPDTRPVQEPAPYQPWAAKKVQEFIDRKAIDDPEAFCIPMGVPRFTAKGGNIFPMQIVQTPKNVVILYEELNWFRVIRLDAKHREDMEPTYNGDSVGHWEGDTLVVDSIGFNDKTWLVGTGTFHTDALHVTERFTKLDKDMIHYDVVMEDPGVFTKPWNYHTTLMSREGTILREYVCEENNQDSGITRQLLNSVAPAGK